MQPYQLNIISFDVPYPANYGGVIDVFYKIKSLHNNNISIHLHCFDYGRGYQPALEEYCETVTYYPRKKGLISFLRSTPYIVQSRIAKKLKENLLKNNFPILFEGLHTCFLLNDAAFKNRKKIVRAHNVEHHYYHHLANATNNWFKKLYFYTEAAKLKKYEPILNYGNLLLAVTDSDCAYFKQHYPTLKTVLVPCFHQNSNIKIKNGKGNYVLYHGNLAVAENENAAIYCCNEIFNTLSIPFVIAGLNPTKKLKKTVQKYAHIHLIENLSPEKIDELIANAQVNLLLTEQPTGLKLKLLNTLYNGRFCLINEAMRAGLTLKKSVYIANSTDEIKNAVVQLYQQEIDVENEITVRNSELSTNHVDINCKNLLKALDFPSNTTI